MDKKKYMQPQSEVIELKNNACLLTVSGSITDDPASGAAQGRFFDDEFDLLGE
ncbi:MAG: hypothetical protein IJV09_02880 [Prevotella sp.]|nr:hypothetical protein [Prevotella sp.]MBQ8154066.1 hypothetical protein [Prevotella sp.]